MSPKSSNKDANKYYNEPEKYVPRYMFINNKKQEVSEFISKKLDEHDLYIIWGLPGSGKTTIARQVAYLKFPQGYRALHIIFRYNNMLKIPKDWRRPPVLMLDVNSLTKEKVERIANTVVDLAKGPEEGETLENFIDRIIKSLEDIIEERIEKGRCEKILSWLHYLLIPIYVAGVVSISIDPGEILACEDIAGILKEFKKILNKFQRRVKKIPRKGVLIIFDNIIYKYDPWERENMDDRNSHIRTLITSIRKGLEKLNLPLSIKQLMVVTVTESEFISRIVETLPVNRVERLIGFISNKVGVDANRVVGRVLPVMIPYPSIEELFDIAIANGIGIGSEYKERLRDIAACSGWHISLVLNTLKIEKSKKKEILSCELDKSLKNVFKKRDEAINMIRRFNTLGILISELAEINLAFLGVLAQPMGISCLEAEALCRSLIREGRLAKPLKPLLKIKAHRNSPTCDFEDLRDLIENYGWNDILSVFGEKWCNDYIISVKVGTYFYHLPDLLAELERPRTLESLERLIDEYYEELSNDVKNSLRRLVEAVQYIRAKLLESQRLILAEKSCDITKSYPLCLESV